jgi:PEP-CTERM motif
MPFGMNFREHSGQQPAISHLLVAGGDLRTPGSVPEPATLALVGSALVGLAL